MSKRLRFSRAAARWGLLVLALAAAGCGRRPSKQAELDRLAELERMARCLRTNVLYTPKGEGPRDQAPPRLARRGLYVDYRFWVDQERSRETTVRAMLVELGASLQDGKVVDEAGRELYFYHVSYPVLSDFVAMKVEAGLMPAPPDPDEEMKELEKRYHVVPMFPEGRKD